MDEVKAMAEEVEYKDGPNDEGEMFDRPYVSVLLFLLRACSAGVWHWMGHDASAGSVGAPGSSGESPANASVERLGAGAAFTYAVLQ